MPAEPPPPWPLTGAFELRSALLASYGAASRSYHDTRHLREVLARLGELGANGTVFDRLPVELAAWFHDAVYDRQPDAEEPHLFHTPYARANWETLARANLDHELTTSLREP
jgi:predicted metal-dependent HD superfamily phosphohydrolase